MSAGMPAQRAASLAGAWRSIARDFDAVRVRVLVRPWLQGDAEIGAVPRPGWSVVGRGVGWCAVAGPNGEIVTVEAPAPLR